MRALFFTDVHGSGRAIEWVRGFLKDGETVIIGGDVSKGGPEGFQERFFESIVATGARAYFVHGNWDRPDLTLPEGFQQLQGRSVSLGKYLVGGLGGSLPTPGRGPFEWEEEEARSVLARLGRVDVLVSHSPPRGTKCDRAGKEHIGSSAVRDYVMEHRPKLVLCGHVHESYGVDRLGETTVANPGALSEGRYGTVGFDGILTVELSSIEGARR